MKRPSDDDTKQAIADSQTLIASVDEATAALERSRAELHALIDVLTVPEPRSSS